MFELIIKGHRQTPHRDTVPMLVSSALHIVVGSAVFVLPLLYVADQIPEVPGMMAFVAAPAPPPPPPPPPAPARAENAPTQRPVPTAGQFAAPLDTPSEIVPERGADGVDEGVPGGVEGGVPGGVLGGVVGGIPNDVPPPPPPPPAPPTVRSPIRVGGEIQAPALIRRVDPEYPAIAVSAQIEGMVILEAIVDREGRVEDVTVLRSIPLLDNAAKAAVRQWQYTPLLLNGKGERFVVTVTVSFRLTRPK